MTTTPRSFVYLRINSIDIGHRLRTLNPDRVKTLANSMKAIGLQTPISVKNDGARTHLVAGLHRIEAAKLLGWKTISAIKAELTGVDLKRWEIAENLHRADLTCLERDQHIAEWIRLTNEIDKPAQPAPVLKGGRGQTGGVRAAARELDIDWDDARRAVKVASLTDEAKQVARELGCDRNRSALLRAAQCATSMEQIRSLKTAKKRQLNRPGSPHRYVNAVVQSICDDVDSLKRMEEHGIDVKEIGTEYACEWAEMLTEAIDALPLITRLRDQLLDRAKAAGKSAA
jgi:ParB-like chromosome segregation protein Spo0J